jgi:hypothetical protein
MILLKFWLRVISELSHPGKWTGWRQRKEDFNTYVWYTAASFTTLSNSLSLKAHGKYYAGCWKWGSEFSFSLSQRKLPLLGRGERKGNHSPYDS